MYYRSLSKKIKFLVKKKTNIKSELLLNKRKGGGR